jgi:hypothetical protein
MAGHVLVSHVSNGYSSFGNREGFIETAKERLLNSRSLSSCIVHKCSGRYIVRWKSANARRAAITSYCRLAL